MMSDAPEQPNIPDRQPQASRKPPKRHLFNLTLSGLPELGYFENDEDRQRALQEIGQEAANLKGGGYWLALLILAASVIAARFIVGWLLHYVQWHHEIEDMLRVLAVIGVALVVLRRLHRWGAADDLRRKLIAAGVPLCLKCGYLLRGLPADVGRCPECGRPFDADVRVILAGGSAASAINRE